LGYSEGNHLSSRLAHSQGIDNHEEVAKEKYHLVATTMTNDLLVVKKKVSQGNWYKWAFVFFGLSALLPNAAILTDMDYFIKEVSSYSVNLIA
jgi:hypothetical protein